MVTFEKVLQADTATVADIYIKGADKAKAATKQGGIATSCMNRLGTNRMPFVWAARPVFYPGTNVNSDLTFSDLYRQEPDRLRQDEFLKLLGEYHRHRMQSTKFKGVVVPGHFLASVKVYGDEYGDNNLTTNTVSHDLLRVKPFVSADESMQKPPRREILPFSPSEKVVPSCFTSYVNYLYIYPMSVNFTPKKAAISSKARNVLCRIFVYESDLDPMASVKEGIGLCLESLNRCITCCR